MLVDEAERQQEQAGTQGRAVRKLAIDKKDLRTVFADLLQRATELLRAVETL